MKNYFTFIFLLLITVSLNTIGQSLLKLGSNQNFLNIYLLSGLFLYGMSTIFYIRILGKFNLSMVYPIVIGFTIIMTTFSGIVIFKEKVSLIQWIGIGLMLSGISAMTFDKIF